MNGAPVARVVPSGFYRTLAAALASIILTGAAAWLTFGANKITRPEMESYVAGQSPWAKHRDVVEMKLKQHDEAMAKIEQQIGRVVESVNTLVVELRVLTTRLDGAKNK